MLIGLITVACCWKVNWQECSIKDRISRPLTLQTSKKVPWSRPLTAPSYPKALTLSSFHLCGLTQPLQGAVAADLGFHGQLVGRRQLGQVVEGVGEWRVAAVVSHAASHDAAAADPARTFTATWEQGGSGGELGSVVHPGSTLWREKRPQKEKKKKKEKTLAG